LAAFFFLLSLLKDGGQERWEQASLAGTSKSLILLEFLSVNVLVVYARVRFAWKLKGKSIYVVVSYCCGWSYAVGVVVLRTCMLPLVLFARFLTPHSTFFLFYIVVCLYELVISLSFCNGTGVGSVFFLLSLVFVVGW